MAVMMVARAFDVPADELDKAKAEVRSLMTDSGAPE